MAAAASAKPEERAGRPPCRKTRRRGEGKMPEHVNWGAAWQSVADTWTPVFLAVLAFLAVLLIFKIVQRQRRP